VGSTAIRRSLVISRVWHCPLRARGVDTQSLYIDRSNTAAVGPIPRPSCHWEEVRYRLVDTTDGAAADQAIVGLEGAVFDGRTLTVNEARPGEEQQHTMAPQGGGGYRKR